MTHEAPSNLCFPLQSFLVYCEISDPMLWLPLQTKHSDVHHPWTSSFEDVILVTSNIKNEWGKTFTHPQGRGSTQLFKFSYLSQQACVINPHTQYFLEIILRGKMGGNRKIKSNKSAKQWALDSRLGWHHIFYQIPIIATSCLYTTSNIAQQAAKSWRF